MGDKAYFVVSRDTAQGREFFYGIAEEQIVCGAMFFRAFKLNSEDLAQQLIERVLTPNDLAGFAISRCGPAAMSDNLRVTP